MKNLEDLSLSPLAQRVALNTGVQMVGRILTALLGIVISAVLARYLGPQGYGQYVYALTYVGFFIAVVWMGLDPIVIREITCQKDRAYELLKSVTGLKLMLSVIGILLALLILPIVVPTGHVRSSVALALLVLPINALTAPGLIFNASLRMEYKTLSNITITLFLLVLISAVVRLKGGPVGAIAAYLIANAIGASILLILAAKFVKPGLAIRPGHWKHLLQEGVPLGLAGFLHQLYYRVDILMLSALQGDSVVGFYSVAYGLFDQMVVLFSFFAASLFPLLAQYAIERDKLRLLCSRGLMVASVASLSAIAVTTLAGDSIVQMLYGPDYGGSSLALKTLIWATPFVFSSHVLNSTIIAIRHQRWLLTVNAIALAVNVLLNLILIPKMSYMGSAIATIATEATVVLLVGRILLKEL